MRAHIIDNGVVINTVVLNALEDYPGAIDGSVGGIGWLWDGNTLTPPVPAMPTVKDYTAALEALYDAKAAERRYDNRFTCALRAGYPGPFQAEGVAFASWMDICNALAYSIMAEVLAHERAQPTIAELLAEMPELVWPN